MPLSNAHHPVVAEPAELPLRNLFMLMTIEQIQDRIAFGRELMQHARSRIERAKAHLESETDPQWLWFGAASIRENERFIEKLVADLDQLESKLKPTLHP